MKHPWKFCRYKGCEECCLCGDECSCAWKFNDFWYYRPISSIDDYDLNFEILTKDCMGRYRLVGKFQVKWDGCSNLWDNVQCAFHFCDWNMIDSFCELLKELYRYTEDLIERPYCEDFKL
jgi:hypothetical protein